MKIILIAHDNKKNILIEILKKHKTELKKHTLLSTLHTGQLINKKLHLDVSYYKSGINGGDLELSEVVNLEKIDYVIFLIDKNTNHPHKKDIKFFLKTCKFNKLDVATTKKSALKMLTNMFLNK